MWTREKEAPIHFCTADLHKSKGKIRAETGLVPGKLPTETKRNVHAEGDRGGWGRGGWKYTMNRQVVAKSSQHMEQPLEPPLGLGGETGRFVISRGIKATKMCCSQLCDLFCNSRLTGLQNMG